MPSEYYSLDGTVRNHSFVLEKINDRESIVKFINENGIVIDETMVLENWNAYTSMYQDAYSLYLLEKYCQNLINKGELYEELTDEDYKMFLSPASYYIINQ